MVEEIKNQIELQIATLEMQKAKATNDRHYELCMELGDQVKGLRMALEIVNKCHQQNRGKTTKAASAKGLMANVEERITAETVVA